MLAPPAVFGCATVTLDSTPVLVPLVLVPLVLVLEGDGSPGVVAFAGALVVTASPPPVAPGPAVAGAASAASAPPGIATAVSATSADSSVDAIGRAIRQFPSR